MDKVGIICEGTNQGGDMQVFRHFAQRILGHDRIDVVPLGSKPALFVTCGVAARALLECGCERILIVWDLLPAWGSEPATVAADEAAVRGSLLRENLHQHPCIFLIAIDRELETWLVSDGAALTHVIAGPPGSAPIRPHKNPVAEPKPKTWLMKKFSAIARHPYLAERNAVQIAQAMPDHLRAISKIPSFLKFKKNLVQPC